MSFVRDPLPPTTSANVPLTLLPATQEQHYASRDDPGRPGPSSTRPSAPPIHPHLSSLPQSPLPPYRGEFSSLTPRRSTDGLLRYPHGTEQALHSGCSTATNTPLPSRGPSPHPFYYSATSSCSSDSETEVDASLLSHHRRQRPWRGNQRSGWWLFPGPVRSEGQSSQRHRQRPWWDVGRGYRSCKRITRRIFRQPFIPKTPSTIVLALVLFSIFAVSLTYLIIYILNPDKEPLPWQGYCTLPQYSSGPPPLSMSTKAFLPIPIPTNLSIPAFPPPGFDSLAPVGVFLGVFSTDDSVERRMLIRSTWASHVRSREGAGEGDGGAGTSRTIVRFILGRPRKDYQRRIMLEMETYRDMVILPINENMNSGKTHAYFSWAAENAWVPPVYLDSYDKVPTNFTYLNATNAAPLLANHDPAHAHRDQLLNMPPQSWVRPDFVAKADDDAFVMLAELEARLRVELYTENLAPPYFSAEHRLTSSLQLRRAAEDSELDPDVVDPDQPTFTSSSSLPTYVTRPPPTFAVVPPRRYPYKDPLVFWGYLVKNRFMGGELYALSYALVNWVANDPYVKTMTHGAEDKQTSKWIRAHPYAEQVRWSSQRCWIYDHPRAGTVYSHGFLFPSEVKRVQIAVQHDLERLAQQVARSELLTTSITPGQYVSPPEKWAHSTVSKWGIHYAPPYADLDLDHSVEALVEGSEMSLAYDDGSTSPELAWKYREGRRRRYENKRVGGTVVVHFIKKNMWFLETAAALLQGEDLTALERALEDSSTERRKGEDGATNSTSSPTSIPPVTASTGMDSNSTSAGSVIPRTMVRRGGDWD